MNKNKQSAYNFLKQFGLKNVNYNTLSDVIERQGYTIVEYSHVSNTDDVETLLNALGVKALSLTTGAFTYADENHRIVFINEGLSDEEKTVLLAHEQGHIYNDDLNSFSNIHGNSITNEYKANEFAHYLLKQGVLRHIRLCFTTMKCKAFCVVFLSLLLTLAADFGVFFSGTRLFSEKDNNKYCITPYGQKYHLPSCPTIEGHELIYGSEKEFKKLGKQPCEICIGEKK